MFDEKIYILNFSSDRMKVWVENVYIRVGIRIYEAAPRIGGSYAVVLAPPDSSVANPTSWGASFSI